MQEIKNVMVIGAGIMGSGIAQVFIEAGYQTYLKDLDKILVEKAVSSIQNNLEKKIQRGKLTEEANQRALANLTPTISFDMISKIDLIVEAATENLGIKMDIFKELDEAAPERTILATNTSSISVTKLASVTTRPDKIVGTHFFNPVIKMKLVEIVRGLQTSDETLKDVSDVVKRIGKEVVEAKDYPAFLFNRILLPMLNEAFYCYMEGQATAENIDKGMTLAMGHPMGPLKLADLIGLDTLLSVFEVMYEGYGDQKYFPCPILTKMVEAGHYGVKSGRGFYNYS